jgi:HlyD family secretion protein
MMSGIVLRRIAVASVVLVLMGMTTACNPAGGPEPTQSVQTTTTAPELTVVSAEAYVVPLHKADLSFKVGGQIVAVEVKEGETVRKDQVLATVDDASQQIGLAQAQAKLESAQASLAETKAGSTPEQIAQSEASLAKAEAALAQLMAGPTPQKVKEAEAKVEAAQASLSEVSAGSRDEEIRAAAASLLQTEADVREAQADYDAFMYGNSDRLGPYGLALEKATNSYEAAKADYDKVVNGATGEEIAVARASLHEAQAALETTKAGASAEEIAQAQAEVLRTQAALAELKAGATTEQVAVAEASVKSAETDVSQAQLDLDQTKLTAPFDGVVGQLDVDEGEFVTSGETAVSLANVSEWRIETDDLNETDVVDVKEGATVTIKVDALPNESLEGKVINIQPKSETKSGDITYTVLIAITQGDTSKLRWGMTAYVDIDTGSDS